MPVVAEVIAFALLVLVLAVAAFTDWKTGKVYNWLTYPAIVGGLIYWAGWGLATQGTSGAINGLSSSSIGLLCGFIPFAVIFSIGGLGGGDVKVLAAIGSISADWQVVLGTAFYGLLIGFLMAIFLMIRHGLVKRTASRIAGAAMMAMSRVKPEIPEDSPRIPLGVAFKIGVVIAGLEHMLNVNMPWS